MIGTGIAGTAVTTSNSERHTDSLTSLQAAGQGRITGAVSLTNQEHETRSVDQPATTPVTVSPETIALRMAEGEQIVRVLVVTNPGDEAAVVNFGVTRLQDHVTVEQQLRLAPGERTSVTVSFDATGPSPGLNQGSITVSHGDVNTVIPISLIRPVGRQYRLNMTADISALDSATTGPPFLRTRLLNLGEQPELEPTIRAVVRDSDRNVVWNRSKQLQVTTANSWTFQLPANLNPGSYTLFATARYSGSDVFLTKDFRIPEPDDRTAAPGITLPDTSLLYNALIGLIFLLSAVALVYGYRVYRAWRAADTYQPVPRVIREETPDEDTDSSTSSGASPALDFDPSTVSADGLELGVETASGTTVTIDPDSLLDHCLVTGSSVMEARRPAQLLCEEALEQGIDVIVLDPGTAWTGFFDERDDLEAPSFDLDSDDARSYPGTIEFIEHKGVAPDIEAYVATGRGEIKVISLAPLETYAGNVLESFFTHLSNAGLDAADELNTLVVFPQLETLLETFESSWDGPPVIEHALSVLGDKGIGVLLVSDGTRSGLRDSVGTAIWTRTDRETIDTGVVDRFGNDVADIIADLDEGAAIVASDDMNHGRPFRVAMPPIKHHNGPLPEAERRRYRRLQSRIANMDHLARSMDDPDPKLRHRLEEAKEDIRDGALDQAEATLDSLEDDIEDELIFWDE